MTPPLSVSAENRYQVGVAFLLSLATVAGSGLYICTKKTSYDYDYYEYQVGGGYQVSIICKSRTPWQNQENLLQVQVASRWAVSGDGLIWYTSGASIMVL